MTSNPAYRDPLVWRAELAGKCGCCGQAFEIGAWIRRDTTHMLTVIDGHQSAVQR